MALTKVKQPKSSLIITKTMLWLLIGGYGLFLVAQSTYNNYTMNKEIDLQKSRIADLEHERKSRQLSLLYFKSNSYKEIEARRRLNLKGPDEHVFALPEATTEPVLAIATSGIKKTETQATAAPFVAWWQLFFGKK